MSGCKWCECDLPDGQEECLDCLVVKGELEPGEWAEFMIYQWDVESGEVEELSADEPIPYFLTPMADFVLDQCGRLESVSYRLEENPALIIGGCHA